jgi:hypothetical protein
LISTKKRPIQEVKGTTKSQSLFRALNWIQKEDTFLSLFIH